MEQLSHDNGEPLASGAFRLDGLRVDLATGRIEGPGGHEQVDPIVMAVLAALIEDSGGVVTRAQLLDRVWHDRVVTEDVVSRCVYQLRQHLVRAGGDKRYRKLIETLPRRGYRLRTRPEPLTGKPAAGIFRNWHASRQSLLFLLLLVVAAGWLIFSLRTTELADPLPVLDTSLVVLPFDDLSADGDQEYLADGITEELINVLARMPDLRVIARTSSFSLKGQILDIPAVARTLSVSHVLEGSVRSSGNRIRVTAQLIDAADNSHLWSNTFERELGDIFVIQDEIASAVAKALEIRLGRTGSSRPTNPVDPQAWARIQEARYLLHRREPGDLDRSEKLFREAVERAPDLVEAWAGLAGVYFIMAAEGEKMEAEAMESMRVAAERAVALDPDHPEAYSRLANWYLYRKDFETARKMFDQAVAKGGDNVLILGNRAGQAAHDGDLDLAISLTRAALLRDPLSALTRHNLSVMLLRDGRYREARLLIEDSLQLLQGERTHRNLKMILGRIHLLEENARAAREVAGSLGDNLTARWLLLMADLISDGSVSEEEVMSLQYSPMENLEMRMAELHAVAGQPGRAFDWLNRGASLRQGQFIASRVFVGNARGSPFLASLHSDPRWSPWLATFDVHELPGASIQSVQQEMLPDGAIE